MVNPETLTVAKLKAELEKLGQPTTGLKAALVDRLKEALAGGGVAEEAAADPAPAETTKAPTPAKPSPDPKPSPAPAKTPASKAKGKKKVRAFPPLPPPAIPPSRVQRASASTTDRSDLPNPFLRPAPLAFCFLIGLWTHFLSFPAFLPH